MNLLLNATINLIVPLALLGIVALFALSGMFWGVVRGFKKQSFRLVWVVGIAVLLFFITPLITKALLNFNLSFLGFGYRGVQLTSINEFVINLVTSYDVMGEYAKIFADNKEVVLMVVSLVGIFINTILYVLLFWIFKIILWPIWAMFSAAIIKKRDAEGKKLKKRRALGMCVGVVLGVFVGATTIMPIMGVLNIASAVEYETSEIEMDNDGNQVSDKNGKPVRSGKNGIITTLGGEQAGDLIRAYNTSIPYNILKYSGIESTNMFTFNALSTVRINNQNISLQNEVTSAVKAYSVFNELSKIDFRNYDKQKLSQMLDLVQKLSDNFFEIKTISAVGDKILPYVINEILTNDHFILALPATGDGVKDYAIRQTLTQVKDITVLDLKNEVNCVLNIAKLLNSKDILAPVLNGDFDPYTIPDKISVTDAEAITNQIFAMKTIGSAVPVVINASFMFIANELEVKNFSVEEQVVSIDEVKKLLNTVINVGLRAYNSLDLNSKYYVTDSTFALLGEILDVVVNYPGLGDQNYVKLINAAETRITKSLESMLGDLDEQYADFKQPILNSISNLSNITSYKQELTKIGTVFNTATSVYESFSNNSELKLSTIGKVLDGIKETTLLGSAVNDIAKATFKFIKTKLPDNLSGIGEVLDRISGKVAAVQSWEAEFAIYQKLYDVILKLGDSANMGDDLLKPENTYFSNLGESVNELERSTLFNGEVKNLVQVVFDYAETLLPSGTNIASGAFTKIKQNLKIATNIDWKLEFETIKELTYIASDFNDVTISIEKVGERIDNVIAKGSKLITRSVITGILTNAVDDFAKEINDAETVKIVNKIKNIIENTPDLSYKREMAALNTLINEIKNINIDQFNYAHFGRMLDEFDISSTVRPSVIISPIRADLVKLIIGKVDITGFPQDLVDIVNKLKTNVDNITSYENEFVYLKKFVDKTEELKNINVTNFKFVEFGKFLDEFDNSALLGNIRHDIVMMILKEAQTSTADAELKEMIGDIRAEVPKITSYEREFTHLKNFVDIRSDIASGSINGLKSFGAKLDQMGNSILLRPIRYRMFAKLLKQTTITETSKNDVTDSINDINAQTLVCAQKAEKGEFAKDGKTVMTYVLIFSEFEGLSDIFNVLKQVNITQDNYELTPFGTCLDNLSALNIVPKKATVRMHKFVLTEIRTIINSWYSPFTSYATPEIIRTYTELNTRLSNDINECIAYVVAVNAGTDATYNKSFANEYREIQQLIANFVNAIKNAVPVPLP